MGNIDELLNAADGKPAGYAYHCIRLPINRNSILPQKKKILPVMYCNPDEGREFAYVQPQELYEAWQNHVKGQDEPQYEMDVTPQDIFDRKN